MKHIRDPVTGRCAVCESNGVDPSVLHNGIFYPDSTPRQSKPIQSQLIEVQEDAFQPSPRQEPVHVHSNSNPTYARYPDKTQSETAKSTASTASASQVTFGTQTSFYNDQSPPASPLPMTGKEKRSYNDARYSPEGSPTRSRYTDVRDPQVWFIGEDSRKQPRSVSPRRHERRISPLPGKKRNRTPSPEYRSRDDNRRETNQYYHKNRNDESKPRYHGRKAQRTGRCCRGCRWWCSWKRCCMIFWLTLLILLLLGALAAAIYFAVAGAENESTVEDITLIEDPLYLIFGVDQPCRTTVITEPTTPVETTTVEPTTLDPSAPTVTTEKTTTPVPTTTTTLILCYDTTTTITRRGSRFRNDVMRLTSSITLITALICVIFTSISFNDGVV